MAVTRRDFLKTSGVLAAGALLPERRWQAAADYTIRIAATPIEVAHGKFISLKAYNGQFPGPLLRFKEGQRVTIDIRNDTDTPEQLHWHGQSVPADVDGAAEEGTPYIPANGARRISFVPQPSGHRFFHTHLRAGANLSEGLYGGQVGQVYIEPKHESGSYDREVFLVLKEFTPTLSHGGDMPQDMLAPSATVPALEQKGESAMKASLARGMPKGFEVGYDIFTINGRQLGHGEPIRVKQGERVLFHVLNGSATEIRSLALPGHRFRVVALDGNPVPTQATVPTLWLGTAERVSAIVEMNHPGVWIMGDTDDGDRRHGMGIVVEYANHGGKAQWTAPATSRWDYMAFGAPNATAPKPDETFEMVFAKDNAASDGFNRWTINGSSYPMRNTASTPAFHLRAGRRYRIHMRNESDDVHPVHLHRHTFEVTSIMARATSGVMKDVVMLGGYQELSIDFVANNPGPTLFHCHQQLHMDYGFMTLFGYV
ncbi:MAG TPA: multicopper oxidase domain-containing protein [Gemmatimonadaceae bacterium]|nr:multicopper oxidase domain-containing protein [Gemmatimonadaceae bacterium]